MLDRTRSVVALFAVLSLAAVVGCASADAPASAEMSAASASAPALPSASGEGRLAQPTQRALRVTIDTAVVVDDTSAAAKRLRAAVEQAGGYVGGASAVGSGAERNVSFELHVPAAKLADLRGVVSDLGKIARDTEKAEDVTEQRADIAARLHNARTQEKRLNALVSDKAGSLADVVAIEKEIGAVRETVERMEAQQRTLEGQIAFATVHVDLLAKPTVALAPLGPLGRIGRASLAGVSTAGSFLVGLGVAIATAGPTLLILGAIAYAAYRLVKRLARRRVAARPIEA